MDILSAALDESGITGDEPFDFDFGVVADNVASNQVSQPTVSYNGGEFNANGQAQQTVFSNALKQLVSQNNTTGSQINTSTFTGKLSTAPTTLLSQPPSLQRSSSTPAVIKLPSTQSPIPFQQIIRQQSAQTTNGTPSAPGKTRIITVKRVGTNGVVSQRCSFAVSADAAAGSPGGGRNFILQRANGESSQNEGAGSPVPLQVQQIGSHAAGTIKIPIVQASAGNQASQQQNVTINNSVISSAFQNQFCQFNGAFPLNSTNSNIVTSNGQVVTTSSGLMSRSQPHVIQINRPFTTTGNVMVTLPQTTIVSNRLVSSQIGPNIASPSIGARQQTFRGTSVTIPNMIHSQSVPAGLVTFSNVPNVFCRDANSPSSQLSQLSRPSGLNSSSFVHHESFNGVNSLNPVSLLSAMQKSVQNIPLPKPATSKDLSRIWSNTDMRLKMMSSSNTSVRQDNLVEEEEEGEEIEALGQAETYSEYMPPKLKLGIKHPDPVVETSSMSSIEPPDIHYKLSIPESVIDNGELSALQLESIVYASQRHEIILPSGERAGFLIGDGAGVGKGRTLAGVIFENYLLGRKRALWLSVSNDLKVDAERDLRDIGAHKIEVHALNKFKYAKISGKENGHVKKGVIFATYSSLIGESHSGGKYKTRFKQLIKWLGKEFDGVIVFDECHKAKNLCPTGSSKPTKTGQTVLELQKRLPKARIVYASATGASEPKNMAYMTRLGLWGPGTPFAEFNDFINAVERRGVGAMELVAMDMKLRGMYIARQLSFKGVSFKIQEIPIDKDFVKMYNEAVKLWVDAKEMFQEATDLVGADHRLRKCMWGQFWSAHQRFFKYLCISAKVPYCVRLAREAIQNGKCVVIGLQSTGEARTLEQLEEMGGELNDFVSTAKGVIQTLVEKHFPAPDRKKFFDMFGLGNKSSFNVDNNNSSTVTGIKRKKEQASGNVAKKSRVDDSSESSTNSDESEMDFGVSDTSDDDDSSDGNDNFNPFGSDSDSDEDPWLKKSLAKSKAKEKKRVKEKKKEKKIKTEDMDEDEQYTSAMAAAGLLKKDNSEGQNNANGDAIDKAFQMKRELLDRIEILGSHLPPNALDQLIDELGGTSNVAEMTGRKGRVVCTDEGINYESRSENDVPLEYLNLTEKQRFMDGEKNIAIISEAASSGISLQADRRAINQRRRVHITLELPWSADRAVQQFGRTHRSNQVSAPEYSFLISELAGEQRFASTVAKRLESLGALTHGDRRATESRDLSRFNFENKYGKLALEMVMKSVCGFESPCVSLPEYNRSNFFEDCKRSLVGVGFITQDNPDAIPVLDKDYNNISKFLNRILGVEVTLQNALFKYFSTCLTSVILEAKRSGRWDLGILDLGSGGESVKKLETKIFVGNTATNTAKTELVTVSVERGMSFPSAYDIYNKYMGEDDGFYVSLQDKSIRRYAIVAAYQGAKNKKKEKMLAVYRPNTGLQPRQETIDEIKRKYKKVLPDEAQRYWEEQYNLSATMCSHAYWRGMCKKISLGLPCDIGLRTRIYHVLSGSVLSVWNKVESVLASLPNGMQTKMQIIRLKTNDHHRIVGSLIPSNAVAPLCNVLSQDCSQTYVEKHTDKQRENPKQEVATDSVISHASVPTATAVFSMPVLV